MSNKQINAREQNNLVRLIRITGIYSHENVVRHALSTSALRDDIDNPFSYGSQMANIYPHKS